MADNQSSVKPGDQKADGSQIKKEDSKVDQGARDNAQKPAQPVK